MVFASKVTPPFLAKALPLRVAPVLKVIDSIANIFPLKSHVVPKVAELPTYQKILEDIAPPAKITFRPDVTVKADAI